MKPVGRRELIQRLRQFGFEGPYGGGKHSFMRKGQLKLRLPNPHHGDISVSLLREILKQAGITVEEWQE